MSVLVLALGIGIWINAQLRPLREAAASGYTWGLGALFAVGLLLVSNRIPGWTCRVGRFDEVLRSCLTARRRTAPNSWIALKNGLVVLGVIGGLVIALLPKRVRSLTPAVVLAWLSGVGWLFVDTMVRS